MDKYQNHIISRSDAKATGLKSYFTGVPCKHGHMAPRLVSSKTCRECELQKTSEWRIKNKCHLKDYASRKYEENKPEFLAQCAAYRLKNKEKLKIYSANKAEKIASVSRKWRSDNKDRASTYQKEYAKKNKHIVNAKESRRRSKKLNATPMWADHNAIGKIYKLAKELELLDGVKRHVDHAIPLVNDYVCGLHVENNLQILTSFENLSKSNYYDSNSS